jgi:hypothetical protein
MGSTVAIGDPDAYDSCGVGYRITGDYLLWPKAGLGLVGLLQATQISEGDRSQALSVLDLGLGLYKDFCRGHVCVKPAIGGGFALFQTTAMSQSSQDSLVGLAVRAEVTGAYAFGARFEHLITATVGAGGYTAPVGDYAIDPAAYGLDDTGSAVYFGVGYTHRFNTPFGQSPFFVVQ